MDPSDGASSVQAADLPTLALSEVLAAQLRAFNEKLSAVSMCAWTSARMSGVDVVSMHGRLGKPSWPAPRLVTYRDEEARPGYASRQAHEYEDEPQVLREKVKILADLVRRSQACVAYTGAGISTASGIDDYASKKGSIATDRKEVPALEAKPTLAHYILVAMHRAGQLQHWIQQNHDGLPQKAGLPQEFVNEIHGAWFDPSNPVAPMSGSLRGDLMFELEEWTERADLCLTLGTSLVGMNADNIVTTLAKQADDQHSVLSAVEGTWSCKVCTLLNDVQATLCSVCGAQQPKARPAGQPCLGSVIVGLQSTRCDNISCLRIFGTIDSVCALLAYELSLSLCEPKGVEMPTGVIEREAASGVPEVLRVPYDANGFLTKSGFSKWDLSEGAPVMITGGPGEGYVGKVIGRTADGHVRLHLPCTREHSADQGRRWSEYLLGSWWLTAAAHGTVTRLPVVNTERKEELPRIAFSPDKDHEQRFDYKRKQEAVLMEARRKGVASAA